MIRSLVLAFVLWIACVSIADSAQFVRPSGDGTLNGWTDDGGGTTNIYTTIDEVSPSDADYIEALNGTNATVDFTTTTVTDPVSSSGHILRFRIQGTGSGGPERCELQLWQGDASQIATTGVQASRAAWDTKTYTLDGATEADAITDYTTLKFRVISSNLGGTEDMWCSWVELEVPDVSTGRRRFTIQ